MSTRRQILQQDSVLSPDQLDDKYNQDGDGRHPFFGEDGWMQDVMNRNTLSGYWAWVAHQIEDELQDH